MPTKTKSTRSKTAAASASAACQSADAASTPSEVKKPDVGSNSKQRHCIALLQRTEGVALSDLMSATGWQAHSVRGFISGVLRKKLGLSVELTTRPDGSRVYRIGA